MKKTIDSNDGIDDTATMNDEIEVDEQLVQDQLFHVELSDMVQSFPPITVEQQTAYSDKMQLLNDIRNELFPAKVASENEGDNTYDSRYYHEYSIGTR